MKKILLMSASLLVLLSSCNLFGDYGTKVDIDGKSEVYYKGDGVSEADAKKLGTYFTQIGVFNGKEEKAVQISKDPDAFVVRLVIKEDVVNQDRQKYETIFWYWQDMISENVFDGKKTRVILTDDKFKDLITLEEVNKVKAGEKHFVFYRKGVSQKEAENIAEKFEKEGIFVYTDGMVIASKENNQLLIRFAPTAEAEKDGTFYYSTLANLQYLVSKYTLNEEVKLIVIDNDFNDVKKFDELTAAEKAVLDQRMLGTVAPDVQPVQYTNNPQPDQLQYAPAQ